MSGNPKTADDCCDQARALLGMAEQADHPEIRAEILRAAAEWLSLAEALAENDGLN